MKKYIKYCLIMIVVFTTLCFMSCNEADEVSGDLEITSFGFAFMSYQKQNQWIYYIDYSTGNLYKTNEAGEFHTRIIDEQIRSFVVTSERIFYITSIESILCTVKLDGSGKNSSGFYIRKIDSYNEWIYVLDFDRTLRSFKANFTEYAFISEDIIDFYVDGDWIYYWRKIDKEEFIYFELWRMYTDGTNKQQLMDQCGSSIEYNNDLIYYIDLEGDISVSSLFASTGMKIATRSESGDLFLKKIGEWLYFRDGGIKPGLYKMKTDGREKTFITDKYAIYYVIWDNWLIGIDFNDKFAIRISDKAKTDEIVLDIISGWENIDIYE